MEELEPPPAAHCRTALNRGRIDNFLKIFPLQSLTATRGVDPYGTGGHVPQYL